jgi:hypothetical protein
LLTRTDSNRDDDDASGTGFSVGRGRDSHGLSGVVGSGVVKVGETRKKGSVMVETITKPTVETMTKVKPPSFEAVVATIANEGLEFSSIGTINRVEKLISEREKISTGTVEDDAKSLTGQGSGGGGFCWSSQVAGASSAMGEHVDAAYMMHAIQSRSLRLLD